MRHAIAIAALLLTGCFASHDTERCIELVDRCGISDGPEFCVRLDTAAECRDEIEAWWACMQRIDCDFPLQCRAEYAALAECEAAP